MKYRVRYSGSCNAGAPSEAALHRFGQSQGGKLGDRASAFHQVALREVHADGKSH